MAESETGKVVYTVPVPEVAKAMPDPTAGAPSKQGPLDVSLASRGSFAGFWNVLQRYGMLKTQHARTIGEQGVPGNCVETLLGQMEGLEWKVVKREDQETDEETDYYTLLLDNAKDENGAVIGGNGLFALLGADILMAHEAGNAEIVRIEGGQYDGVPVAIYAMDGSTLRWKPRTKDDEEPIAQVNPDLEMKDIARFRHDEIMHIPWRRYNQRGRQWYNRHPVQVAWVALNCLAAGDDYNYSLLTEVIPQGLLNLGPGFDRKKAMEWRDAWKAARHGGKLEDIALLWGTDKAEFIRFQEQIKEQPFQHMSYWYLTIVTGAFGMSPLDIGFMTQLNTKAGAEVSAELSKNKGLAHLLQVIKKGVEYWILPAHLEIVWPDLDPSDEAVEATTRKANTDAITTALDKGLIDRKEGREEAVRLGTFEIDPNKEPEEVEPQEEEEEETEGDEEGEETVETEEGNEEEEAGKAYVAKSHVPEVVQKWCPLCEKITKVNVYADHGGLCVCTECECTFDPAVE